MKKIRCVFCEKDFLQISHTDSADIILDVNQDGKWSRIRIGADKIRKLRKQLKRALVEIEASNGPQDMTRKADGSVVEDEKKPWIPKPGGRVKFVDESTLDFIDKCTWRPKVGEIYVVRHVYDGGTYKGFSLMEAPDEKYTDLSHGYKFRASGFEPVE